MPRTKGSKNKPKKVEPKEDLPTLPAEDVLTKKEIIEHERQINGESIKTHRFTTLTPDRFPLNRDIAGDAEKQFAVEIKKLKIKPIKVTRTINYKPNEKGMYVTEFIVEY